MTTNTGSSAAAGQDKHSAKRPFFRWILWAIVIVLLDQASKWWILQNYQWGQYTPITSFFNIVRAHNTGAAFSFLADHGGWQQWLFVGIAAAVSFFIIWQLHRHGDQKLASFSFSSILGGAIGNVVDRLQHGYVVDYLDFYWNTAHFPAFNIADIAISIGVIGMLLSELVRWKKGA